MTDVAMRTLYQMSSGDSGETYSHEMPVHFEWINKRVVVKGEDFEYKAKCLCSFPKSNGKVRYIVEDNGRLFIQRREQLTFIEDRPFNPPPKVGTEPPPGYPTDQTAMKNG